MATITSQHLFSQNQLKEKSEFDRSYCNGTSVNARSPIRTLSNVLLIRALLFALLVLESTGARSQAFAQAPNIFVNEFMASNNDTLLYEDGDSSYWIELHNDGATGIDLQNWSLTDDATQRSKWRFPAATIPA